MTKRKKTSEIAIIQYGVRYLSTTGGICTLDIHLPRLRWRNNSMIIAACSCERTPSWPNDLCENMEYSNSSTIPCLAYETLGTQHMVLSLVRFHDVTILSGLANLLILYGGLQKSRR